MIKRDKKRNARRKALVCQLERAGCAMPKGGEAFNYSLLRAIRAGCIGFALAGGVAHGQEYRPLKNRDLLERITIAHNAPAPRVAPKALPYPSEGLSEAQRKDLDLIAWVLYHEARGEGLEGVRGVASVIWYRSTHSGRSFQSVLVAGQFAAGNGPGPGFINPPLVERAGPDWEAWRLCYGVASLLVRGEFVPDFKADHFYSGEAPTWARHLANKRTVGNHHFGLMRR